MNSMHGRASPTRYVPSRCAGRSKRSHAGRSKSGDAPDTGERYEQRHDWRTGARGHTALALSSSFPSLNQILRRELCQLISGTTSASSSGGRPGLIRNLDNAANQGLGIPHHRRDTFPLGDSNGTQLSSGCGYPTIRSAESIAADAAYLPTIGEGIDAVARNEFLCTRGLDPSGESLPQPQTAIGKGLAFETADFRTLAEVGAGLIWTPRSNIRLYGDIARVTSASALSVEIALGTDWTVTGSMNMLRELACADAWNDG